MQKSIQNLSVNTNYLTRFIRDRQFESMINYTLDLLRIDNSNQ